jgi:hypothetical protein
MVRSGVEVVGDSGAVFIKKEALIGVSYRYLPLEWGFLPRKNAKSAEGKAQAKRWGQKYARVACGVILLAKPFRRTGRNGRCGLNGLDSSQETVETVGGVQWADAAPC